nr:histone deacetylase family protein [Sphingomonas colocasiae]
MDCYEVPERAARILASVQALNLGPVVAPPSLDHALLSKVHDADYLEFLETIHAHWVSENGDCDAFPYVFLSGRSVRPATAAVARLGQFATDACSPITAQTWTAACASAASAVHAAELLRAADEPVMALCRPPGHHAGRRSYGGYCFLNNGALAAERLLQAGAGRVAILDIDNHHGNGTQEIFYERSDVMTVSIHGTPDIQFPWFTGYSDETGAGKGEGFNLNRPLQANSDLAAYEHALIGCLDHIGRYGPDAIIVALGVDAGEGDPTSQLRIDTSGFAAIGARIASLAIPTVFIMEGGYNLDRIGGDVGAFLQGWHAARRT